MVVTDWWKSRWGRWLLSAVEKIFMVSCWFLGVHLRFHPGNKKRNPKIKIQRRSGQNVYFSQRENLGYPWEGTLAAVPQLLPHIALYVHYIISIYRLYICWYISLLYSPKGFPNFSLWRTLLGPPQPPSRGLKLQGVPTIFGASPWCPSRPSGRCRVVVNGGRFFSGGFFSLFFYGGVGSQWSPWSPWRWCQMYIYNVIWNVLYI